MVDITESMEESEPDYDEQIKVVFPKAEEELIDFLNKCKLKDFKVMLYPRCNTVFDGEVEKVLENTNIDHSKRVDRRDQ